MKLLEVIVNLVSFLGRIVLFPFEAAIKVISDLDLPTLFRGSINDLERRKRVVNYYGRIIYRITPIRGLTFRKRGTLTTSRYEDKKTKFGFKIRLPKIRLKLPKFRFGQLSSFKSFIFGILFAYTFIFLPYTIYSWYADLPSPELLSQIKNKSTKILDRNGRLLYEIYIDRNYDPVKLSQIPQHVIQATIAIEDDTFYNHAGIRPVSMLRAAKETILTNDIQGGSTITQQLVKNVLLTPEQTISRKLKEIVLAVAVDGTYTKDEILEMYLNNISYGGTSWGIQSASVNFFGKNVWDLDLAEASLLAGLPSAPSVYSPFIGGEKLAKERQLQVLNKMVEQGFITEQQLREAYTNDLQYTSQAQYIRAPHFVNYVRSNLEQMYGTHFVNLGGLTVTTTLDLDLQEQVQQIVTEEVARNSYLNFSNGAAVILNPRTNQILAYVGSIDYFSNKIDGKFDVVTANRMPGSAIKPVTYALALQNGFTAASVIEDEEVVITIPGQKPYIPVNYDNQFHGKVTLRQALASSYNIPAVKLVQILDPDNMVKLANKMGLVGWEVGPGYGLSVTLGGKEVKLIDLTNVFATFARKGYHTPVTPFTSITDVDGYSIYEYKDQSTKAIPEEIAYIITDILSDNNARAHAFGSYSDLVIYGHKVAVKTGTTDQKRDNWTLGYTPSYVVGVWVGNNDNTPMHPYLSSGLSGASPIWNRIMTTLLQGKSNEEFDRPKSVFVKVDEKCDNKLEVFVKGTAPAHLCDLSDKDEKDKDD